MTLVAIPIAAPWLIAAAAPRASSLLRGRLRVGDRVLIGDAYLRLAPLTQDPAEPWGLLPRAAQLIAPRLDRGPRAVGQPCAHRTFPAAGGTDPEPSAHLSAACPTPPSSSPPMRSTTRPPLCISSRVPPHCAVALIGRIGVAVGSRLCRKLSTIAILKCLARLPQVPPSTCSRPLLDSAQPLAPPRARRAAPAPSLPGSCRSRSTVASRRSPSSGASRWAWVSPCSSPSGRCSRSGGFRPRSS